MPEVDLGARARMRGRRHGERGAIDVAQRGDVLARERLEVVPTAPAAPNHGQAELVTALRAKQGWTRGPGRAGDGGGRPEERTAAETTT